MRDIVFFSMLGRFLVWEIDRVVVWLEVVIVVKFGEVVKVVVGMVFVWVV